MILIIKVSIHDENGYTNKTPPFEFTDQLIVALKSAT